MKADFMKSKLYGLFNMKVIIGASIVLMVTIVAIVISQMGEREELYLEGMVKGTPFLQDDKMKFLGDKYTELEAEFESKIKEYMDMPADRHNKCDEEIHYGVNGKENCDEMINNDYVNGIITTYDKGGSEDRKDGESNFIDMLSVLSTALGSNIDSISNEDLEEAFTNLFWMSHTFTGSTTELYPCTHGCRWIKYYCGDNIVTNGSGDGNGYYDVDSYMGIDGLHAMKNDPFLVSEYPYPGLDHYIDEWWDVYERTYGDSGGDTDYFYVAEPEGSCFIHEQGMSLRNTTKAYRGCVTPYTCYHGTEKTVGPMSYETSISILGDGSAWIMNIPADPDDEDGEDMQKLIEPHNMGSGPINGCLNYNPIPILMGDGPDEGPMPGDPLMVGADEEAGIEGYQKLDENGREMYVMGSGYYECTGHPHYKCYGHILCCCMGHTNLNLNIKIMYHDEMLEKMAEMIR